jgi:hypothetical protein
MSHKITYWCDWCGSLAKDIGPVEVGWLTNIHHVFLCTKEGCAHEMERHPTIPREEFQAIDD